MFAVFSQAAMLSSFTGLHDIRCVIEIYVMRPVLLTCLRQVPWTSEVHHIDVV